MFGNRKHGRKDRCGGRRGTHGRHHGFGQGFGRGGGASTGFLHTLKRPDEIPVMPRPMDTGITLDACPLCKNHCPASAPGCPKGEAFFESSGKGC